MRNFWQTFLHSTLFAQNVNDQEVVSKMGHVEWECEQDYIFLGQPDGLNQGSNENCDHPPKATGVLQEGHTVKKDT